MCEYDYSRSGTCVTKALQTVKWYSARYRCRPTLAGHERERFAAVSDNERAGRIRYQYLSQFGDGADLPVELLHRMAADIAEQCGLTRLKAHRLARGWTVTQAVEAFHSMCRRESRQAARAICQVVDGLGGWRSAELGLPGPGVQAAAGKRGRTGLGRRLLPGRGSAPAEALAVAAVIGARSCARDPVEFRSRRQGRRLLHLPPDIRDFTGRAEQVGRGQPADRRDSAQRADAPRRSCACPARAGRARPRWPSTSRTGLAATFPTGSSTRACAAPIKPAGPGGSPGGFLARARRRRG